MGVIEVGWDGDDRGGDLHTEVVFGNLFHLSEDHGRNLLWHVGGGLALGGHLDMWLSGLIDDVVWQELLVVLEILISERSTDESLHVVDGSGWIGGGLVLGSLSDEPLLVGEGDNGWGDSGSELIRDDLDSSVLEHSDAGVGGTQIDTDDWALVGLLGSETAGD